MDLHKTEVQTVAASASLGWRASAKKSFQTFRKLMLLSHARCRAHGEFQTASLFAKLHLFVVAREFIKSNHTNCNLLSGFPGTHTWAFHVHGRDSRMSERTLTTPPKTVAVIFHFRNLTGQGVNHVKRGELMSSGHSIKSSSSWKQKTVNQVPIYHRQF